MAEADTAPPATLLVLYVLAECPDTPLSRADLQTEIAHATGRQLSDGTLDRTLRHLRDQGRVKLHGTNPYTYQIADYNN